MNVAVLLSVYNRKEVTLRGLRSLYKAIEVLGKGYSFDVYMTDDGCTDGTAETVKEEFPYIHVIHGDGNLYWNRGMIIAWKAAVSNADYDFYLWFNDDVYLYKDSLINLFKSSKYHKDHSLIVGSMCDPNDKSCITYTGHDISIHRLDDCSEEQECYATNGNLLLIPRIIYEKIGTNDPIFHHGEGDLDYGIRARKAGFKNFVASGVFGECARHDNTPRWCDTNYAFSVRVKSFYSSYSIMKRSDSFKFQRRYKGFFTALLEQVKDYMKLLFPQLAKVSKYEM